MSVSPETVDQIRQGYLAKLPEKIQRVESLWNCMQQSQWSEAALSTLFRISQTIMGNSRTFGLPEIGHTCGRLHETCERFMHLHKEPSVPQKYEISHLIKTLRSQTDALTLASSQSNESNPGTIPSALVELEEATRAHSETLALTGTKPLVYIVDEDIHMLHYLALQLSTKGFEVRIFETPQMAAKIMQMTHEQPVAALLETFMEKGNLAATEAAQSLRKAAGYALPLIFISAKEDTESRLRAVRAGGNSFYAKPIHIESLASSLENVIRGKSEHHYRILFIQSHLPTAEKIRVLLADEPLEYRVVKSIAHIMEDMHKWNPDLLLIDPVREDIPGKDLVTTIRQDEKLLTLPIILISDQMKNDNSQLEPMFAVSHLSLDSTDKERLLEDIYAQCKYSRQLKQSIREISRIDIQTGLITRRYFLDDVEQFTSDDALSSQKPILIYILVDHIDVIREKLGLIDFEDFHQALANIILAEIADTDIATQLAEGVFAIRKHSQPRMAAEACAQRVLESAASHIFALSEHTIGISLSIGLLPLDENKFDLRRLLHKVEHMTETFSFAGGNRLGWNEAGESVEKVSIEQRTNIISLLNRESFRLAFQPVLNVLDQSEEMYEVLTRLVDENGKVILPSAFLPEAARLDKLVIIDHWVIENALLTLSQSLEHENAVLIIKLSDDSLQSKQLLPFITKCICNANLKGDHRIIFELNEKAIITAHKEVTEIVKGLHKINCGLAIDHFGTTNDSHKLASELAVDFIKIHNPAINQILQDASARAAMHSLIQSAVQSDRKIIVGALEDPKIMSLLCEWGVSHFLGYFIQEPYQALSSPVLDTVVTINL